MPTLITERTFRKIILPSSQPNDEAWVEVYDKVLASDMVGMSEYGDDRQKATIHIVTSVIKAWNFTDKDGKVLPITAENVQYLPIGDFAEIIKETGAFKEMVQIADIKKNNSSTTLAQKPTLKTAKTRHSPKHQ